MSLELKIMKANESNEEIERMKQQSIKRNDFGEDYINEEISMIKREQDELDQKAIILEKNLRKVMKNGDDKKQEDLLIKEWFLLVNRKNAIIHRQLELEML
jgi:hypothetical protein